MHEKAHYQRLGATHGLQALMVLLSDELTSYLNEVVLP